MSFYQPRVPLDNNTIDTAFENISSEERAEINRQVKNVDGQLKFLKAKQKARLNGNGGTAQTNFGARSGLELMAALGRWFAKMEKERPEDWVLLLRSQSNKPT